MMKQVKLWLMICLLLMAFLPAVYAAEEAFPISVVTIKGEIDAGQEALLSRAIRESKEQGVKLMILEIDTFGGQVDSAVAMRDMLVEAPFGTAAYISPRAWSAGALLALATDTIIMSPGSSIGAAEPIPATEKTISAVKSEFSATAHRKGHPVSAAEAMVDKTIGYPGYAEKGQILSLTETQAQQIGLAAGSQCSCTVRKQATENKR